MKNSQLEQLILMVNQIVDNNSSHNSDAQIVHITIKHLQTFWPRSMKDVIIDYVDCDGAKLNALAKKAIESLSARSIN